MKPLTLSGVGVVSFADIGTMGQRWFVRMVERLGVAVGLPVDGLDPSEAQTPVLVRLSLRSKLLFFTLNRSARQTLILGREKFQKLYSSSGQFRLVGQDFSNSKAWSGGKGSGGTNKWSREAYHVSLSSVGRLAGGIVENYSVLSENRQPFIKQVVQGRADGQYDQAVFEEVRALFERDKISL
ncbi:MAG: hypothetical protein HQL67_03165 [Magnetococcales bacterium]|nr:hypothetical protein [Magnetococcales bacterium]